MEMPVETLKLIQETAQIAQAAAPINIPGDGRTAYFSQGGAIVREPIPPANRKHVFRRLDDLIDMAKLYTENDGHPIVWHDQTQVLLILDDADRRDYGNFPLEGTPQFQTVVMLETNQPLMTQKELIRLLRVQLNLAAAVIAVFRRIDWTSNTSGQGTVERGKESLGRQIERQVAGAQEIPEFINLPIPLYRNVGEDEIYSIRCLVDFDIDAAKIQIVPEPGEIDHAMHAHQMNIRRRLEEALSDGNNPVPIYFGMP